MGVDLGGRKRVRLQKGFSGIEKHFEGEVLSWKGRRGEMNEKNRKINGQTEMCLSWKRRRKIKGGFFFFRGLSTFKMRKKPERTLRKSQEESGH